MQTHAHRAVRSSQARAAAPPQPAAPAPARAVLPAGFGLPSRKACSCGGGCPRCSDRTRQAVLERAARTAAAGRLALRVAGPHEAHERQADRMAERLLRAPAAPAAEGATAAAGAPGEAGVRAALSGAPASVRSALAEAGRPLPEAVRADMEARLGYDLGHVRLHEGAAADRSARALGARAYTVGPHVVFRSGAFRPDGAEGRRTLAHELVHVVQQTRARSAGPAGTPGGTAAWRPIAVQPMLQRDLAIEPPHPDRDGRVLTEAEMQDAIDFNLRVIGNAENAADLIEQVRDVLGVSPTPAAVDEDFVNAVVDWQAAYGLTQDGRLGPATARPLFREFGAEGAGRCEVAGGPTYNPAGAIAPTVTGGVPRANFAFRADFRSDPANGVLPSCCEIRQFIRWNAAAATSHEAIRGAGNVTPHGGFPAAHPADRWIEDRDAGNHRYGHRSGAFSDPQTFDQYLDAAGRRNQAFGHRYRGSDAPGGVAGLAGQWRFLLRVVDVCNGDRNVGGSAGVRVNW